jgi:hypothetical protein
MPFPSTSTQLALNQPLPPRPVYDIPPFIVRRRRVGRIRRPFLQLTRARPTQPANGSTEVIAYLGSAWIACERLVRFDSKESR